MSWSLHPRHRLRRWHRFAFGSLLLLAVWLAFLPVPIGAVINTVARRWLPAGYTLQVAAATWRWQVGDAAMRVEVRDLTASGPDGSHLALAELAATFDKRAVGRGHHAPSLVTVQRPSIVLASKPIEPPTFARENVRSASNGTADASDLRSVLGTLGQVWPGPHSDTRIVVSAGTIEAPGRNRRAVVSDLGLQATIRRSDDRLTAEVVVARGKAPNQGRVAVHVAAALSAATAEFSVEATSLPLTDLVSPLIEHALGPATVTFSLTGECDNAPQPLRSCSIDIHVTGAPATHRGPMRFERLLLRAGVTRGPLADGGNLGLELERGLLVAEWGQFDLRKLTAKQLGAGVRLSWAACGAALTDTAAPEWPADFWPAAPLWLPAALRHLRQVAADSVGELSVQRTPQGEFSLSDFSTEVHLTATVAEAPLAATVHARRGNDGDIVAEVRLDPFEPACLAPAFPADLPLAACAFPLRLDGRGRLSTDGVWREATARAVAGLGAIRAWGPMRSDVALRRAEIAMRVDGADRIEVPEFVVETSLGAIAAEQVFVQAETDGSKRVGGRVAISEVAGTAVAASMPSEVLAVLKPINATPSDFTLSAAHIALAAQLQRTADARWRLAAGEVTGDATLQVGGKALGLRVGSTLPAGEKEVSMQWAIDEFRPAEFGRIGHPLVLASNFDLPVRVAGAVRLDADAAVLRHATVQIHAGAGYLRVPGADVRLPLHAFELAAEYNTARRALRISHARIGLTDRLSVAFEAMEMGMQDDGRIAGRGSVPVATWREVEAWWPASLWPDARARVCAHLRDGRFEVPGVEFDFPRDLKGIDALHARGRAVLHEVSVTAPGWPRAINVSRTELAVDWPRLRLTVPSVAAEGLRGSDLEISVSDIVAERPVAAVRGMCTLDIGAAVVRSGYTTGLGWPRASGQMNATFEGNLPWPASDPSGARMNLEFVSPRLTVPGWFEGPLAAVVRIRVSDATTLSINATIDPAGARIAGMVPFAEGRQIGADAAVKFGPGLVPVSATLGVRAADFAGLPFALSGALRYSSATGSPAEVTIARLAFGRTALTGTWSRSDPDSSRLDVDAERVDVTELAKVAVPWLQWAKASEATEGPVDAERGGRTVISAHVAALEFGPGRIVRAVRADGAVVAGWPERLRLHAVEGEGNTIRLELTGAGESQRVTFAVEDASALARTVTEPFRRVVPLAAEFPALAGMAGPPSVLLAGGTVRLEGELRGRGNAFVATGRMAVKDATLTRAPRLLQLLALKSGRKLQQAPLIRELAIANWSVTSEAIDLGQLTLSGSGLIDQVKLKSARYFFRDARIAVDGDYFGVGFTVAGTRADPQIYLKENLLIRTIGQRNEFDFFDDSAARPAGK